MDNAEDVFSRMRNLRYLMRDQASKLKWTLDEAKDYCKQQSELRGLQEQTRLRLVTP